MPALHHAALRLRRHRPVLLLAALAQNTRTLWQGLGMLSGVAGIAVAGYHVSLLLNPKSSCGIDPLGKLGQPTAHGAPAAPGVLLGRPVHRAAAPALLGISIPGWSLIWLVILTLTLAVGLIRREKNYR